MKMNKILVATVKMLAKLWSYSIGLPEKQVEKENFGN